MKRVLTKDSCRRVLIIISQTINLKNGGLEYSQLGRQWRKSRKELNTFEIFRLLNFAVNKVGRLKNVSVYDINITETIEEYKKKYSK